MQDTKIKEFTCNDCGTKGSVRWMQSHDCQHNQDVDEFGGRCEDYPCCGHTDGDGCKALESHTKEYYYDRPHLLHEPGSPEWYDAMDDYADYDEED
jgi:hypothetical protein